MIGPTRVTLVDGKSLDGIGVIREAERVRLILEDGTEIAFEPSKVASVKALADMDAEERAGPAPTERLRPRRREQRPARARRPSRPRQGAGPTKGASTAPRATGSSASLLEFRPGNPAGKGSAR